MKTIYLDNDFICHIDNVAGRREINIDDFDDKCNAYIEGGRYIPFGESWTNQDGVVFIGPMVAPVVDINILLMMQKSYEQAKNEDLSDMALFVDEMFAIDSGEM